MSDFDQSKGIDCGLSSRGKVNMVAMFGTGKTESILNGIYSDRRSQTRLLTL